MTANITKEQAIGILGKLDVIQEIIEGLPPAFPEKKNIGLSIESLSSELARLYDMFYEIAYPGFLTEDSLEILAGLRKEYHILHVRMAALQARIEKDQKI